MNARVVLGTMVAREDYNKPCAVHGRGRDSAGRPACSWPGMRAIRGKNEADPTPETPDHPGRERGNHEFAKEKDGSAAGASVGGVGGVHAGLSAP
ncbi:hypothetical protein JCM14635_30990 [Megalodesulfovibrio paquesii]